MCGRIKIGKWGIDRQGDFEPLISEELFTRVQLVINGRTMAPQNHKRLHPDFPLRHFARCGGCNKPLTAAWSTGRNQKYPYYRCPNSACRAVNVRREKLEETFCSVLEELRPSEDFLRCFNAMVLDIWRERQKGTRVERLVHQKKVEGLRIRKDRLVEAFVYERAIDQATYSTHLDKLNEDIALAEMALNDATAEALDVEGTLNFAEYLILNAANCWQKASLEQKLTLQRVWFPSGITYDGETIGTTETCMAFSYLRQLESGDSRLG
jgi:hypothetical protein